MNYAQRALLAPKNSMNARGLMSSIGSQWGVILRDGQYSLPSHQLRPLPVHLETLQPYQIVAE